jgi:hypothetical protein
LISTEGAWDGALPDGDRWNAVVQFPKNVEIGILDLSLYDVIGGSSDRLWNISIFPTSKVDDIIAMDDTQGYIPNKVWDWPNGRILQMFNVKPSIATQIDLSQLSNLGLVDMSVLIANSATSDGAGIEYAEINLNTYARKVLTENPDPIVYK